jgi:hypothetical protein
LQNSTREGGIVRVMTMNSTTPTIRSGLPSWRSPTSPPEAARVSSRAHGFTVMRY